MDALTQSMEDYLEAIHIISQEKKVVRIKDIAKFLNVKTPSVVDAIGKLADKDLAVHERYGYLELTKEGTKRAKIIYRKHKDIFKFFNEILGISHAVSARDACSIEHYLSKETLGRMVKFVKFIGACQEEYPLWLKSFNCFVKHKKTLESCFKNDAEKPDKRKRIGVEIIND